MTHSVVIGVFVPSWSWSEGSEMELMVFFVSLSGSWGKSAGTSTYGKIDDYFVTVGLHKVFKGSLNHLQTDLKQQLLL